MEWETLLLNTRGKVAVITLNRPARLNALNGTLLDELASALEQCEHMDDIVALVLTGGPKFFCSGGDVNEPIPFTSRAALSVLLGQTRSTFRKVEDFGKPIIAAISGVALGGGVELALCCDLRIASETAKFGLPETKLGAIPGAGGTQRLLRLIGPAFAKQLIFTGEPITATDAYRIGLVNQVWPVDQFMEKALELATSLSERAPLALRMAKTCINTGLQVDQESGLNFETECILSLAGSEDLKEGMLAFREKRKPQFKGR